MGRKEDKSMGRDHEFLPNKVSVCSVVIKKLGRELESARLQNLLLLFSLLVKNIVTKLKIRNHTKKSECQEFQYMNPTGHQK